MKFFIAFITVFFTACSSVPYVKVGTGYKLKEIEIYFIDGSKSEPLTARIEVGAENGNWTYGLSHSSQWLSGKPFNNDMEYSKTELFLDYTWKFK